MDVANFDKADVARVVEEAKAVPVAVDEDARHALAAMVLAERNEKAELVAKYSAAVSLAASKLNEAASWWVRYRFGVLSGIGGFVLGGFVVWLSVVARWF